MEVSHELTNPLLPNSGIGHQLIEIWGSVVKSPEWQYDLFLIFQTQIS